MPHKHKRKRDDLDKSTHDLPPSTKAAPLPAQKPQRQQHETLELPKSKRRKQGHGGNSRLKNTTDDTPKQFARLMAFQNEGKRLPKGLDDGNNDKRKKGKKQKQKQNVDAGSDRKVKDQQSSKPAQKTSEAKIDTQDDISPPIKPTPTANPAPTPTTDTATPLKIQPGERLRDFSLRVDQSLPLSAIPKHSTKVLPGEKAYLTKHNKKLARMQQEWRNTEARLKEKEAEDEDDVLDKREEDTLLWMGVDAERRKRKGKKKRRGGGDSDDDGGDVWKQLEKKRAETKQRSLQDVVKAPPVLKAVKNMFKEVRDTSRHGTGGRRSAVPASA